MLKKSVNLDDNSRMRKITIFINVFGGLLINCTHTLSMISNKQQFYKISIILLVASIILTMISVITSFSDKMLYDSLAIWGALNLFTAACNLYIGSLNIIKLESEISKIIILFTPILIILISIILSIDKLKRYLNTNSRKEFNLDKRDTLIISLVDIAITIIVIFISMLLNNNLFVFLEYDIKNIFSSIILITFGVGVMVASGISIGKRLFEFIYKINLKKI